jgi:hypothetical protein
VPDFRRWSGANCKKASWQIAKDLKPTARSMAGLHIISDIVMVRLGNE